MVGSGRRRRRRRREVDDGELTVMSVFDRAMGALDRHFGEAVLLSPVVKASRTGPTADPDRPEAEIWGVYVETFAQIPHLGRNDRDGAGATELGSHPAALTISAVTARSLQYDIKKGDLITLVSREKQDCFAVDSVQPTDLGDQTLRLVRSPQ